MVGFNAMGLWCFTLESFGCGLGTESRRMTGGECFKSEGQRTTELVSSWGGVFKAQLLEVNEQLSCLPELSITGEVGVSSPVGLKCERGLSWASAESASELSLSFSEEDSACTAIWGPVWALPNEDFMFKVSLPLLPTFCPVGREESSTETRLGYATVSSTSVPLSSSFSSSSLSLWRVVLYVVNDLATTSSSSVSSSSDWVVADFEGDSTSAELEISMDAPLVSSSSSLSSSSASLPLLPTYCPVGREESSMETGLGYATVSSM